MVYLFFHCLSLVFVRSSQDEQGNTRRQDGSNDTGPELDPDAFLDSAEVTKNYSPIHGPESTGLLLMGALVTVMVSPHLADGCAVAQDAVTALVADGWTPPADVEEDA